MNKNSDFNIEQILDILSELNSGGLIISELQDNMQQYEELLSGTISELMNIGSITKEIQGKIDKNVKYVMNEIDSVMNSSILLRKISTKKVDLLLKLARGIKYSYKLENNTHVMGPEFLKFDPVTTDVHNNIITIGDKTYQFSTKDDFNNDRSEISEISEISDLNNQYSDDEDELPDLEDDNLPDDGDLEELMCIEDGKNKYDAIIAKLVDILNIAYKTATYYCQEDDDTFDVYFGHLVIQVAALAARIKDSTVNEISVAVYKLDSAVKSSRKDFDINHDNEICQRFEPFFSAMDYHLDKTQKLLQNIIGAPPNKGTDGSLALYVRLLETEIRKTKNIKASLDLVTGSISYIKESIETDVVHFNLFDEALIKKIYTSS